MTVLAVLCCFGCVVAMAITARLSAHAWEAARSARSIASQVVNALPPGATLPKQLPYRTADEKTERGEEPAPTSTTVIDWVEPAQADRTESRCPACARRIAWPSKAGGKPPRVCTKADCGVETPHFHLTCDRDDHLDCGFKWIMRAAMTKTADRDSVPNREDGL